MLLFFLCVIFIVFPFRNEEIELMHQSFALIIFTVKTLKIETPRLTTVVVLNIKQLILQCKMSPKDVDRMANSVDPDQTAP